MEANFGKNSLKNSAIHFILLSKTMQLFQSENQIVWKYLSINNI